MGFNGEILVGRGAAFTAALTEFWNWEEEVVDAWALNDGWQAVHVRSPAEDDERVAVAAAADGSLLVCEVFEGVTGHVRGISAAGRWEAWLNPGSVAGLRAWNTVDEQRGGNLYPDGTPEEHAQVERLTARFAADLEAERSAAAHAATTWAAESGLLRQVDVDAAADRVEEVLAAPWGSSAHEGFFALLSALGLSSA